MFNPFLVPAGLSDLTMSWHCEFPMLFYCCLKENIQKRDLKKDRVVCPFPSMRFPPPLRSCQGFRERRRWWGLSWASHLRMCRQRREEGWHSVRKVFVPPALCCLLCPLPSPVIISVCPLLSFLRISFLAPNSASQPLLPSPRRLLTSEMVSHGNGQLVQNS